MKRSPIRPRRREPRRREAPRWTADEWAGIDMLLRARAGDRCEACGHPLRGRAERHHRQRRRDGGDRLANLLLLSPECHAWVTTHPDEARRRGLIVSAYEDDPAAVPVLHRGRVWVLLGDGGEKFPAGACNGGPPVV